MNLQCLPLLKVAIKMQYSTLTITATAVVVAAKAATAASSLKHSGRSAFYPPSVA